MTKDYIVNRAKNFSIIIIIFYVIGEIVFRMPGTLNLMNYDFDPELGYIMTPGQRNSMGLANFSKLSPPIFINQDGYRNKSSNYSDTVVIALGSSEVLGAGVEDDETWSYLLEKKIFSKDMVVTVLIMHM